MSTSSRRPHRRARSGRRAALLGGVGSALVLAVALSACTPAPPSDPSPSGGSASGRSPSASSSPTATASPSSSTAGLTIDITIAGGRVTPNAEKLDVARGTTVTLNVRSDSDDEIHAHTAGDGYELEVTAGEPATGSFVAADSGSFEIESHHLEKVIAILQVR